MLLTLEAYYNLIKSEKRKIPLKVPWNISTTKSSEKLKKKEINVHRWMQQPCINFLVPIDCAGIVYYLYRMIWSFAPHFLCPCLSISLLINFCTWQMLVAITGFSNSFFQCIVAHWKPTTTVEIMRLLVLKDRPPMHNSKHIQRRWRQLSVFINIKRTAFCFMDLALERKKKKQKKVDDFVVWRKFWFHFIVNALKIQSKICVFPYANTFDLKKSFNPKWIKWRTGFHLNRVFELMLSEKLNRHKKIQPTSTVSIAIDRSALYIFL